MTKTSREKWHRFSPSSGTCFYRSFYICLSPLRLLYSPKRRPVVWSPNSIRYKLEKCANVRPILGSAARRTVGECVSYSPLLLDCPLPSFIFSLRCVNRSRVPSAFFCFSDWHKPERAGREEGRRWTILAWTQATDPGGPVCVGDGWRCKDGERQRVRQRVRLII